MKTTIRLMSEFVVGAVIAFIIILFASCEEAKAAVTVNTNLVPPMPPIVTITKKTVNLSAGTSGAAKSTSSTTSAATQNVSQPLVIVPPPKTNYVFPSIGNLSNVTAYAAQNVNDIGISAQAYNTNGQLVGYGNTVWAKGTNVVTSKVQLDQQVIVPALSNIVLYNFCTNSNPIWDKSKGVVITVLCDVDAPNGNTSQALLWYSGTIQLVKNTDGTYSVPDLSWFSTLINDPMPFYVPSLQWARFEVGSNGLSKPFEVYDNLYRSGSSPLSSDTFMYLSTRYITNSSTYGGNLWAKTLLYDGTNIFQIFDLDGNVVPRSPATLAIVTNSTIVMITASNKDSGTAFVLQSSTNLSDVNAWKNISPVVFASPTNGVPQQFTIPKTNDIMFFRTVTTNMVPH